MRTTISACLLAAALVIAACSSSDSDSGDSGSSSAGGDQDQVAELLMETSGDEGFKLNRDCVDRNVDELTDSDAKALVETGLDGDAEISAAGDAIGEKIFSECVDAASYLDALVASFGADDPTLDTDCLTSALAGKTVDEIDEELFEAAIDCTSEG
jgi:hypothetical protein